jgi:tetratricopeptide (TPR) repeat protein
LQWIFFGSVYNIASWQKKRLAKSRGPCGNSTKKAMTAFERKNFDYAIAIFNQVLAQEPGFFDCRQALRVSQHQKSGGGSTFFKKMLSGAGSSPLLAKAQMQKDPLETIKTAEQILNSDPNSMAAHKLLAERALAADLPKTAVLSLEIVTKNAPKDEEAQKTLARAYSAAGQGEKAEMIMAELMRRHPGDLRLADELKDISARKTLAEGGYDALSSGTGSYRDILKDKDKAVAMEQEGRQVKTDDVAQRQIAKLEAELAQEPNDLKKLRTVAELYAQQRRTMIARWQPTTNRREGRGDRFFAAKGDCRDDDQETTTRPSRNWTRKRRITRKNPPNSRPSGTIIS